MGSFVIIKKKKNGKTNFSDMVVFVLLRGLTDWTLQLKAEF